MSNIRISIVNRYKLSDNYNALKLDSSGATYIPKHTVAKGIRAMMVKVLKTAKLFYYVRMQLVQIKDHLVSMVNFPSHDVPGIYQFHNVLIDIQKSMDYDNDFQ